MWFHPYFTILYVCVIYCVVTLGIIQPAAIRKAPVTADNCDFTCAIMSSPIAYRSAALLNTFLDWMVPSTISMTGGWLCKMV